MKGFAAVLMAKISMKAQPFMIKMSGLVGIKICKSKQRHIDGIYRRQASVWVLSGPGILEKVSVIPIRITRFSEKYCLK